MYPPFLEIPQENYQYKRVGTFSKWNFLKSSKLDNSTFHPGSHFLEKWIESIMLWFGK
jgi:hypothetical protein